MVDNFHAVSWFGFVHEIIKNNSKLEVEVCKRTANIYTTDHSYCDAKSAAFLKGIPMKFWKNSVN